MAGPTEAQLKDAARKALAAGNTASAKRLIAAARAAGAAQPATPAQAAPAPQQPAMQRRTASPEELAAAVQRSEGMNAQAEAAMGVRPNTVGGVMGDIASAGAAGLGRGAMELVGLPGTLVDAAAWGADKASRAMGGPAIQATGSPVSGAALRGYASDATRGATEYQGQTMPAQFAGTVGEFVGGGAGAKMGLAAGLASEAAGQMTEGTAAEPWARVIGGLAGPALASGANRLVRAIISPNGGVSPERLKLAKVLEDAGVPITAGQKVGNNARIRSESRTAAGERIGELQGEEFTRAALETAGISARRATPDVLDAAARRIGSEFDAVVDGIDITPSGADLTRMADAMAEYRALSPKDSAIPILGNINTAMVRAARSGNPISARDLKSWRSTVSKATRSADGATREAAQSVLEVLDDSMNAALTAAGRSDDIARLATARGQWRNLLAIEKSAAGAAGGEGILTPGSLRAAVVQQGRSSYARGKRGDLGELSRAGQDIMKPPATVLPGGVRKVEGSMVEGNLMPPAAKALLPPFIANAPANALRGLSMTGAGQRYLGNQAVAPGAPMDLNNALRVLPGSFAQ